MASYDLRDAVTAVLMPVAWRLSRRRVGNTLHRFAEVEADSAWQYLNALELADDTILRRKLFDNFVEELEHAERFRQLAAKHGSGRHRPQPLERTRLAGRPADIPAFLAYTYLSELSVARRFGTYARSSTIPEVRAVYESIVLQEQGHHQGAWQDLLRLTGSGEDVRRLVRKAKLTRGREAWLRFGRRLGGLFSVVWLSACYVVFAPLLFLYCRRRLGAPTAPTRDDEAMAHRRTAGGGQPSFGKPRGAAGS